jgi:hypothetical protein
MLTNLLFLVFVVCASSALRGKESAQLLKPCFTQDQSRMIARRRQLV